LTLRRIDLGEAERLFYPVIPVVVTAKHGGRVGGMVAAWWTQVSFKPLLVAVAIAPERYTYKLVKLSGVFALNILDARHLDKFPLIGDVSERFLRGKLEKTGLRIIEGDALRAPIIADAVAAVEARVWRFYEAGDHDIVVGEVVAAYASEDFSAGMWRLEGYRPVMYLGRTRRPGPVRRVYLVVKEFDRKVVDYAPGDLARYAEARRKLLDELYKAASESSSVEELKAKVAEVVRRYGLEEDDTEFLLEEARRRMKTS
jgi:flavin reductase (DIM6/NTAB) family NADH-FMN oxidoreductase RutF